jgi:uncharacterized protein DUF4209
MGHACGYAANIILNGDRLQDTIREIAKDNPLHAMVSMDVYGDRSIKGRVGSVQDDIEGRSIVEATRSFSFMHLLLSPSLREAVRTHGLDAHHLTSFAGRSGLFEDLTLVFEGIESWFDADLVKCLSVLTPMIEAGLRRLAIQIGVPEFKPHPTMQNREVSIGLGDILSDETVKEALGPDVIFYFNTLYVDARRYNLRNEVTHGLITFRDANSLHCDYLIHSLLLLGCWPEISTSMKARQKPPPPAIYGRCYGSSA